MKCVFLASCIVILASVSDQSEAEDVILMEGFDPMKVSQVLSLFEKWIISCWSFTCKFDLGFGNLACVEKEPDADGEHD